MATDINRLNQEHLAIVDKIVQYGKEINASERVIQAAINFANVESTFDPNAVSKDGIYKGLFQYNDKTWKANFTEYIKQNPTDILVKEPASAAIFDEVAQVKIMFHDLIKWEDRYDEGKIATDYKPDEKLYHVTEELAKHGVDITNNFLHYAYLRHNTGPQKVIQTIKGVFTADNLAAIQKIIVEFGNDSTPTENIFETKEEEIDDNSFQLATYQPKIQAGLITGISINPIYKEDILDIADTTGEDMCRHDLAGMFSEPATCYDNQEAVDTLVYPEEASKITFSVKNMTAKACAGRTARQ